MALNCNRWKSEWVEWWHKNGDGVNREMGRTVLSTFLVISPYLLCGHNLCRRYQWRRAVDIPTSVIKSSVDIFAKLIVRLVLIFRWRMFSDAVQNRICHTTAQKYKTGSRKFCKLQTDIKSAHDFKAIGTNFDVKADYARGTFSQL